jgi:hypothetical protein
MADETTWFQGLDADVQAHIVNRGLDKLEPAAAAAQAAKDHFAAQKVIGIPAEQVIKLPKDATDPSYQAIFDRVVGMSTPKTPEEYNFDGVQNKAGAKIADADAAFVRDIAVKYKLPLAAARGLASDLVLRGEATGTAQASATELNRAANNVALRTSWGGEYDAKAFAATKVAEAIGFTPEVLAAMAALPAEGYVKNMSALASLSSQLNEATILRGGNPVSDPTAGYSQEQARARLNDLRNDREWGRKYLAGDVAINDEFQKLTRLAIGQSAR